MRAIRATFLLLVPTDALLASPRFGIAPLAVPPPLSRVAHNNAVKMGARTAEQRAAFPAAKDTADIKTIVEGICKARATKTAAAIAVLCAITVGGRRLGWFAPIQAALHPVLKHGAALVKVVVKAILGVLAGPAAQSLGARALTRFVDYAVPAVVVVFALAIAGGGGEGAAEADGAEGGDGLLQKLLKGKAAKKVGAEPSKEYIRIESLSDKLSSMAYR
jgi:hypothetical protein